MSQDEAVEAAAVPQPVDMLVVAQNRVIAKLNADAAATNTPMEAIDPTVWLNVFQTVIQVIQQCRAAKTGTPSPAPAVANMLANPTMLQKIKLRRGIVSKVGRGTFRATAEKIFQHLTEVGAAATAAERETFVNQVAQGA